MKKTFATFLSLTCAVILGGCGLNAGTPSNTAAPVANTPATQAASMETDTITIHDFAFDPATVTVKKGATVTWTNDDPVPHEIKSETFNSGVLNKGQSYSFTFSDTGTFTYTCAIHPSMSGTVTVQ